MIFDSINNRNNYSQLAPVAKAFEYLAGVSIENMPTEKTLLNGDDLYAVPVSLTTKPAPECVFEAHRKYIDVHYILSGVETISISPVHTLCKSTDFDAEADVGYFHGAAVSINYLSPGYFLVCWPEDAHRIGMMQDEPGEVKKIVVKVKVPL